MISAERHQQAHPTLASPAGLGPGEATDLGGVLALAGDEHPGLGVGIVADRDASGRGEDDGRGARQSPPPWSHIDMHLAELERIVALAPLPTMQARCDDDISDSQNGSC
jgi:hypothetical protein